MKTLNAIALVALVLGTAVAQEKTSPGKLMIELEEALPRNAPAPGQPIAFGHAIDWEKKIETVGEILSRASGTKAEPHALFVLGACLYNAGEIEQAKATYEDLKGRFPKHPLCTRAKGQKDEVTLVDQAIEDCADELAFRKKHKVKELPKPELDPDSTTTIHLSVGDVKIRFYKNAALEHRKNFLKLAKDGYYDRLKVHRIIPGHLVQMGCPNTRQVDPAKWGRGGPKHVLDNEFSRVTHKRGTLTMWRGPGRPQSHGSQFQIILKDQPHLDFVQTPFAEIVEGLDVIDNLSRQTRNQYEAPVSECFLNGVTTPKS